MENTIKISCPVCGAVLTVVDDKGNSSRNVTCPVCKKRNPFVDFKIVEKMNSDDEPTQYPGGQVNITQNSTIGRLQIIGKSLSFHLKEGKNLIGRKANVSSADIQIPCTSKRMSREHLVIEVQSIPNNGFMHYVYLNKKQVNPTYIGNILLEYGDKIVLQHNDIIKLPDTEIRFEIPDDEETEIQG